MELIQQVVAVRAALVRHFAVLIVPIVVAVVPEHCIEHRAHLRMVDIDLALQIGPVEVVEMVAVELVGHMAVVRLDTEVLLVHLKSNESISFQCK